MRKSICFSFLACFAAARAEESCLGDACVEERVAMLQKTRVHGLGSRVDNNSSHGRGGEASQAGSQSITTGECRDNEDIPGSGGWLTCKDPAAVPSRMSCHSTGHWPGKPCQCDTGYQWADSTCLMCQKAPPFTYNETVARMMASMAQVAFCGKAGVEDWTVSQGTEQGITVVPGSSRQIDVPSSSPLVGRDNSAVRFVVAKFTGPAELAGMCLLSFRGTSGAVDTIHDMESMVGTPVASDWNCDGCNVAKGFYDLFRESEHAIVQALTDIDCTSNPLAITGHSMGGALATLAAWRLKDFYKFKLGLFFSFEAPRSGMHAFVTKWQATIGEQIPSFRVTHHQDPVPHVPTLALGYYSVPYAEAYYEGTKLKHICTTHVDTCAGPTLADWGACPCSAQHINLAKDLGDVDQHCGDHGDYPLVYNGNICKC